MAHGSRVYPKFLYSLLPRRKNRRPFHVTLQERTDSKLLSAKRIDDFKRILNGLRSEATKKVGEHVIEEEIKQIPNEKVRQIVIENLKAIENENRRDFRF